MAVKVFQPGVELSEIDREIQGLVRVHSHHVARLLDASVHAPDGRPCIVLPRLDQGGLARLLAERVQLSVGEVATLLIPMARAVSSMHASGVAHGQLEPRKVLFDDLGAPVLIGGARMQVSDEPPSPLVLREHESYAHDRRCLYELAMTVAARANPDLGLLETLGTDAWRSPDFPDLLVARAFDAADPVPVHLPWRDGLPEPTTHRLAAPARAIGERRSSTPGAPLSDRGGAEVSSKNWIQPSRLRDRLLIAGGRARLMLTAIRPRYRVLALASAVVVALAVGVSARDSSAASSGLALPAPTSAIDDLTLATGDDADEIAEPRAAGETDAGETDRGETDAAVDAALAGVDPVAAGQALIAGRAGCLTLRSPECLSRVLQEGSAIWASDHALIAAAHHAEAEGPLLGAEAALSVVDTMGGVVLLRAEGTAADGQASATTAASVLIVRTEAGWRIRDVYN